MLILSAVNSGILQDRNSSMSFFELKSNFDLLASSLKKCIDHRGLSPVNMLADVLFGYLDLQYISKWVELCEVLHCRVGAACFPVILDYAIS